MTSPPPATDRMVQASELRSAREVCEALAIGKSTLSRRIADGSLIPLRTDPLIFHSDDVERLKRA